MFKNARPSTVRDDDKLVLSKGCTCCNYIDASKRKQRKAHLQAAKNELADLDRKEKLS